MTQSSNVEITSPLPARPTAWVLTVAEWLMVMPAAVFIATAMLRMLQPPVREPARLCWAIFEWGRAHVSHLGAAVLFLALPGMALIAGSTALWRWWRRDQPLREDSAAAFAILRRRFQPLCLAAGTLLAAAIVTLAVHQMIVG